MPLPMVHLSIAVTLSENEGRFPSPDYLLGNIAPDAIHMRPHTTKQDKEHVHFMELGASPQELVYLFQTKYGMDESGTLGFIGGYLTHLLTDRLWWQTVIAPFRNKFPSTLPESDFRTLYYQDTDGIDIDLYRMMPWRPQVWSGLETAKAKDFALLLTEEEILRWRDRTLLWFNQHAQDLTVHPVYISFSDTQIFIKRAAKEIAGLLSRT